MKQTAENTKENDHLDHDLDVNYKKKTESCLLKNSFRGADDVRENQSKLLDVRCP